MDDVLDSVVEPVVLNSFHNNPRNLHDHFCLKFDAIRDHTSFFFPGTLFLLSSMPSLNSPALLDCGALIKDESRQPSGRIEVLRQTPAPFDGLSFLFQRQEAALRSPSNFFESTVSGATARAELLRLRPNILSRLRSEGTSLAPGSNLPSFIGPRLADATALFSAIRGIGDSEGRRQSQLIVLDKVPVTPQRPRSTLPLQRSSAEENRTERSSIATPPRETTPPETHPGCSPPPSPLSPLPSSPPPPNPGTSAGRIGSSNPASSPDPDDLTPYRVIAGQSSHPPDPQGQSEGDSSSVARQSVRLAKQKRKQGPSANQDDSGRKRSKRFHLIPMMKAHNRRTEKPMRGASARSQRKMVATSQPDKEVPVPAVPRFEVDIAPGAKVCPISLGATALSDSPLVNIFTGYSCVLCRLYKIFWVYGEAPRMLNT